MKFGYQLEAPEGLGCLKQGIRYYFAGRGSGQGCLFVWFYQSKSGAWRVGHIHLPESMLEDELNAVVPGIRPCGRQLSLPLGLAELEGMNFNEMSALTFTRKQSHQDAVSQRLEYLYPVLERENEILESHNPLKEIAKIHRKLGTSANIQRLQYWFFSYILHGRNQWALKPSTHMNGTWSRRDDSHNDKKFGRSHADGKRHGWPSAKIHDLVIQSYLQRCGSGKSMKSIHAAALEDEFGCITQYDAIGKPYLIHPKNQPFPTYGQYRYVVISHFGIKQVQESMYGQARIRRDSLVDKGSYSSQFANALESLEVDAYRCDARPLGSLSNDTMPALVVARAICGVTGKRLGIGFSLGGETQEAYRAAIASMAMPPELLASIYGIPLEMVSGHEPVMARALLSDRGPAGQQSLMDDLVRKFPIKSITASHSAQSKPTVEAANPKSTELEGAPSFVQSGHSVANMMKREVLLMLSENNQSNIIERLTPSAIHEFHRLGYPATPHFYWKYLSDRLRTCAQSMEWPDAIRAFGTKTLFKVDKAGLDWKHVTFSSPEFREGLHENLIRRGVSSISGYTLSLVTRGVWVELNGILHQLEPNLKVRSDKEELLLPLSSLVNTDRIRAEVASATREVSQASLVHLHQVVKEQTGNAFDKGNRLLGSPKKARTATAEATALRGGALGRKHA